MANYTPTQGRYLAFIQAFLNLHGYPPSESEIAAALCVSPPSAHLMLKTLERKGLILRHPGYPRSLELLIPEDQLPSWNHRRSPRHIPATPVQAQPPAKLYVFKVFLTSGPVGAKYASKEISRVIEIRGDQTLEQLHKAIFQAYNREQEHLYEFQFGKRPYDPRGPNYGLPQSGGAKGKKKGGYATTTTLDELKLTPERVFGYWFDFGDDWFHQIQLERIEQAIPTVTYPRITRRVGQSPPQYPDE
jgi:hypothetical protein